MVAAFSVARHGPASRSAALRKMAARSSKSSARQAGAACLAASMAAATSTLVALPSWPSTCARLCGCTTSISSPAAICVLAADGHGELGPLAGELLDLGFQRGSLVATGLVLPDRLVAALGVLETASITMPGVRFSVFGFRFSVFGFWFSWRWRTLIVARLALGQVRQLLGGVPAELVAFGPVHGELRVVIARVGRGQRVSRPAHVVAGILVVHVRGRHARPPGRLE